MFNAYYMHHVQLFIQLRRINKRGTRKITWCNTNFNVFEKDNDFLDKPQYVTSQHIDEFGYTSDQNHQHIIFTAKPQK